jgi:hypothetical protein
MRPEFAACGGATARAGAALRRQASVASQSNAKNSVAAGQRQSNTDGVPAAASGALAGAASTSPGAAVGALSGAAVPTTSKERAGSDVVVARSARTSHHDTEICGSSMRPARVGTRANLRTRSPRNHSVSTPVPGVSWSG